jgi:hypothetical protein
MVDQTLFSKPDQKELLLALMEKQQREVANHTKEEALASLQAAGILDEKGDFTAPYSNLARVVINL